MAKENRSTQTTEAFSFSLFDFFNPFFHLHFLLYLPRSAPLFALLLMKQLKLTK